MLDNTGNLVGVEVGGDHTGSGIRQKFIGWDINSGATIAEYLSDETFTITADTTLYAIYTTGTDVVGKIGPGGGWVFYINPNALSDEWTYLEAAPEDQSTGIIWAVEAHELTLVPGGTGTAIGTGSSNTDNIIGQNGAGITYAAGLARAYNGGGYTDWFLPSKDELNQLYDKRLTIGGFYGTYRSSSESTDPKFAWCHAFTSGGANPQFAPFKDTLYGVRAVRAF